MADRDAWEKAESISKIFAAVLIPVVAIIPLSLPDPDLTCGA